VDAGVLLWLLLWPVRCVEVVVVSNGILSDGIFKAMEGYSTGSGCGWILRLEVCHISIRG
jgi:Na+-transporting NADH:ubiquinone oxidoreductase subunit NqrE